MKEQRFVQHPRTKKKLSVSRDVYSMIEEMIQDAEKNKKKVTKNIGGASSQMVSKTYKGETNGLKIAIKFKENGEINDLASPQVEIKDNSLSPQDLLYQFMLCVNQAQATKTEEQQRHIKEVAIDIVA